MSYVPANNVARTWTAPGEQRNQLFSDIADATPTDRPFQLSALVGQLPTISQYTRKIQGEVLCAIARCMCEPDWPGDGFIRVKAGWYKWRFSLDEHGEPVPLERQMAIARGAQC